MFENPIPYTDRELIKQPQNIGITCSAINCLKLIGALVDPQTSQKLINKVLETRTSLEKQDLQEFAQEYGYEVKSFFPIEEHVQINDMVSDLVFILNKSPILQSISTHLSKRNKLLTQSITALDMKEAKGKLITHSVVVFMESQTRILIIDPYNPKDPEVFSISNNFEQLRFLSWIMSSYYQDRLEDKANMENILDLAQKELSQPRLIEEEDINMFSLLQAKIRYLSHKI